ncbi:MAG: hypothetical protein ACW98A_18095 [Candidatus Hodarchaeales archaeon]|jgi:hypothetical protein
MSKEEPRKPRLKGFAKFMQSLVNIAMGKQECRDFVKAQKTRVLFSNKEDLKWAALITIIDDCVTVEGIQKDPDFVKKVGTKLRAWAWWEFPTTNTLTEAGEWKSGKWIRKMGGKKTKGASQIAIIAEVLSYARSSE